MSDILQPGAGLLFMKVGTHAQENLENIIARKKKEIDFVGHTLWGYGGNTCHPSTMVRPFAQAYAKRQKTIYLVMEQMESSNFAEPFCAAEWSSDGLAWERIPQKIEVRGSRYALVIRNLRSANLKLPLHHTVVPVGPSRGRLGSRYVSGHVDKACLEVLENPEITNENTSRFERPINLIAELMDPYAVFLRNYR